MQSKLWSYSKTIAGKEIKENKRNDTYWSYRGGSIRLFSRVIQRCDWNQTAQLTSRRHNWCMWLGYRMNNSGIVILRWSILHSKDSKQVKGCKTGYQELYCQWGLTHVAEGKENYYSLIINSHTFTENNDPSLNRKLQEYLQPQP